MNLEADASIIPDIMFIIGAIAFIGGLVLTLVLHVNNIRRVHRLMELLQHKNVSKENFYKEMTVPQGINFTALAFSSWIMLFVAAAFLFFLVPTILPYSFMDVSDLASNPMGFFLFGLVVGAIVTLALFFLDKLPDDKREFRPTELYSFYSIPKETKRLFGPTIPVLWISVALSVYLGTIYPERSMLVQLVSLALLLASTVVLVMPVYKEAREVRR